MSYIRASCNILEVAREYGISVKGNKASCPSHEDKTPSMSFKNNRFKCWSCGISGSVIDLVSITLKCSIIEASKELNAKFNLNLDFHSAPNPSSIKAHNEKIKKQIEFKNWEKESFNIILGAYKQTKLTSIENFCLWWIQEATDTEKIEKRRVVNRLWNQYLKKSL